NRRGGRAEDANSFVARLFEPSAESAGPFERVIHSLAANQDVGERAVGRLVHPAAEAKFFFVEADKVVLGGVLHGIVILKISLQYHLAGSFAAPGASGDLG